jgi:S-adenosylmethionine/arginine decarboxylase-like enzyme
MDTFLSGEDWHPIVSHKHDIVGSIPTSATNFCFNPNGGIRFKEMTQPIVRDHKHIIVRAYVKQPPRQEKILSDWCHSVISSVGMKVIGGPLIVYSDMEGNKGHTAVAVLDFSHLSIHVWDEIDPALIEFDLFSCKDFDVNLVLAKLQEFEMLSYSTLTVDRNNYVKVKATEKKYNQVIAL